MITDLKTQINIVKKRCQKVFPCLWEYYIKKYNYIYSQEEDYNIMQKTIWLENLSLFNKMVQKSGGIMEIKSSYTDFEGDTIYDVIYTKPLTTECEIEYQKMRIKKETKQEQIKFTPFTDKRGRTWEWFIDESYYHMTCVRLQGETDFNSSLSFHFNTSDIALKFVNLLKQSS